MEIDTITINNKEVINDIVIYYDGELLSFLPTKNIILLCYNRYPEETENSINKYEEWFYIKCSKKDFSDYLNSKKDLLSCIQDNKVFLWKRFYKTFYDLKTKDLIKIEDLSIYQLPSANVYLNKYR